MSGFTQSIKDLHLDLTNRCTARCPQCLRYNPNYRLKSGLNKNDLSFDLIKSQIDKSIFENCDQVAHSGTTGDPTMNPEIVPIIDYIQKINPKIFVRIHTNGDMHDPDWWYNFGLLMKNTPSDVQFAIDGLSDTHELYRVNTKYERIIENAKAFIKSGASSSWQFIYFKHNQHQIPEAKELASQLGFKRFKPLRSTRFIFNNKTKVTNKGKTWFLEPSTIINEEMITGLDSKKDRISCKSMDYKMIYIYPDGTVWPCHFLGGLHAWNKNDPHLQIDWSIIKREIGELPTIHDDTLSNILKSKQWNKWQFVLKGYLVTCKQQCSGVSTEQEEFGLGFNL